MPSDEVLPEGGRPGRGQLSRRGFLRSTLSGAGLLAAGEPSSDAEATTPSATSSTTSTTTASNAPKRGSPPCGDGWGDPCGHAGRGRRDQLSRGHA